MHTKRNSLFSSCPKPLYRSEARYQPKTRFDNEAQVDSEMDCFILFSMKHVQGFCCLPITVREYRR